MQLRTKLAAIASAGALIAGLGVAFAGPAGAVNEVDMCVNRDNQCAKENGAGNQVLMSGANGTLGQFLWNVPTTRQGQISWYNSNPGLCMQVDSAGGNIVILASCAGRASEEWIPESVTGGLQFYNSLTGLCLNDQYYNGLLNAAQCGSVNEVFTLS